MVLPQLHSFPTVPMWSLPMMRRRAHFFFWMLVAPRVESRCFPPEDGLTAFSAVSISEDGRRVFLADPESGNIAVVDMETHRPTLLSCPVPSYGPLSP